VGNGQHKMALKNDYKNDEKMISKDSNKKNGNIKT
jgi:hypothetical protein